MRRALLALLFAVTLVFAWRATSTAQPTLGTAVTCSVVNNNATALTAFTGLGCVGNDQQTALYISSISASASVIATTTANQQLTLKYGTGTACATGTTTIWSAYNLAFAPVSATFDPPLRVPPGNDLCWMHAAVGSKTFIVTGWLGPL